MNRRQVIQRSLLSLGSLALGKAANATQTLLPEGSPIKHSACRWCYQDLAFDELCERGLDIGLQSIELLRPSEWGIVQNY